MSVTVLTSPRPVLLFLLCCTVTNSTVSSTKRQGRGSKVLWMRCLAESKLLAAYDDGALIMWSLENDNTWKLLSTSATGGSYLYDGVDHIVYDVTFNTFFLLY